MNYIVVSSIVYTNPLLQRVQSGIESYCYEYGYPPKEVEELLDFCIKSEYHPNDMILDDFDLSELRINTDFNGFYVVYFIGPDKVDNGCKTIIYQEMIDKLDFESYINFKGDILLGGLENEVIEIYKEKYIKKY